MFFSPLLHFNFWAVIKKVRHFIWLMFIFFHCFSTEKFVVVVLPLGQRMWLLTRVEAAVKQCKESKISLRGVNVGSKHTLNAKQEYQMLSGFPSNEIKIIFLWEPHHPSVHPDRPGQHYFLHLDSFIGRIYVCSCILFIFSPFLC